MVPEWAWPVWGRAGAGPRRQAGPRSRRGRAAEVAVPRSEVRLFGSSPRWRPKLQMPLRAEWRRRSAASLSTKTARKPRLQPPGRGSGGQNVATKGCCPVTQLVASRGLRADGSSAGQPALRRCSAVGLEPTQTTAIQSLPERTSQGDPKKSARREEGDLECGGGTWCGPPSDRKGDQGPKQRCEEGGMCNLTQEGGCESREDGENFTICP